jgi:hypothetical protein
MYLLVYRPLKY